MREGVKQEKEEEEEVVLWRHEVVRAAVEVGYFRYCEQLNHI